MLWHGDIESFTSIIASHLAALRVIMSKLETKATANAAAAQAGKPSPDKTAREIESHDNEVISHSIAAANSSSGERHLRISIAAYRRAETRGFAPGGELEDWLAAEREVDEAIND
jgi:hypothetical protein